MTETGVRYAEGSDSYVTVSLSVSGTFGEEYLLRIQFVEPIPGVVVNRHFDIVWLCFSEVEVLVSGINVFFWIWMIGRGLPP